MAKWKSYEEVSAHLLDQFAAEFGLARVEGKQELAGRRSGTVWEIDAKGFRQDGSGFVIVECRRYTNSKQSQGRIGSLTYQIIDAGAEGGIIVSPLGLQEGARRVATAENIVEVRLNEDCTQSEYVLQFLNKVMMGFQESLSFKASLEIVVRDGNGNIVHREPNE